MAMIQTGIIKKKKAEKEAKEALADIGVEEEKKEGP